MNCWSKCAGELTLISSPALLSELADVISRPKFDAILVRSNTSRSRTLDELHRLVELIEPPPLPLPVCRDADDDVVAGNGHRGSGRPHRLGG